MEESNMPTIVRVLWDAFYSGYDDDAFKNHVAEGVDESSVVLEIGAGSGRGLQQKFPLKDRVRRYVGIDLDPRVQSNPWLHEAHVCSAENLPFDDEVFDLVFHTMVAEHLENPSATLEECFRVLKPGGMLLFETPSVFYYPMIVARATPHSVHEFLVKHLGSGRVPSDVFPTYYRMNTANDIAKSCSSAGFTSEIRYVDTPPGYLRFSAVTFLVGTLYQRSVGRMIPPLRARIWVRATRPVLQNVR